MSLIKTICGCLRKRKEDEPAITEDCMPLVIAEREAAALSLFNEKLNAVATRKQLSRKEALFHLMEEHELTICDEDEIVRYLWVVGLGSDDTEMFLNEFNVGEE